LGSTGKVSESAGEDNDDKDDYADADMMIEMMLMLIVMMLMTTMMMEDRVLICIAVLTNIQCHRVSRKKSSLRSPW